MIFCNGSCVPTYASFSLNNLPFGLINQFIQSNGSSNNWITMYSYASSAGQILLSGVYPFGLIYQTLNTSIIPQGTNYFFNALTTTSPNEITLTLATNILNGRLIDNTIDIST